MKRENGDRQMQSLRHIKPPGKHEKRHGKHPTLKPEALLDRILRASTDPRALVLDPFCGSGTTGVVCARTGRRFVGIDLVETYLDIAAARLSDEVKADQLKLTRGAVSSVESIWIFHASAHETHGSGTWAEIVSAALKELGGEGHLREINRLVERNPRTRSNVTWPSTVRRVVRQSRRFETIGRGRYRLRDEPFNARTPGDRLH